MTTYGLRVRELWMWGFDSVEASSVHGRVYNLRRISIVSTCRCPDLPLPRKAYTCNIRYARSAVPLTTAENLAPDTILLPSFIPCAWIPRLDGRSELPVGGEALVVPLVRPVVWFAVVFDVCMLARQICSVERSGAQSSPCGGRVLFSRYACTC